MVWALDVTRSWALVGGSAFGRWENGLGVYLGPPFLCPPWLSVLGIPCCLVMGVRSRVRHFLGARGAGMARGCW
jgi:hypothetical protein